MYTRYRARRGTIGRRYASMARWRRVKSRRARIMRHQRK